MNRKAVIYSRVSTNDQTIENQLQVLREVADKRGLEVLREISDEGISGATGRDGRKEKSSINGRSIQETSN